MANEFVSGAWKQGIFDGKVVFCTGGAGTICSNQVRALVYLGANACIVGRDVQKAENMARDIESVRPGSRVLSVGGVDVRNLQDMEMAAKMCAETLGSLDYAIAGAAGNFLAGIHQLSSNAFKTVMDIDLLGSFNTLKATLPYLEISAAKNKTASRIAGSSPGGRIIFIGVTIHYTGLPLQAHVAAAKAGVDALSASAAIELGPRGITSNVIAPGPIAGTEGFDRLIKEGYAADLRAKVPIGRYGSVKDIADATVFLFSDAANYVNGDIIVVDGGAWRVGAANPGEGFKYPDFLLSENPVEGTKGGKKSKL